ncbi:hypothetical protein PLESTM_000866700 [Pleodorina starrii]|nr:hypothetical protein PLESTM_000866700 [Pleodorina starrii]
MNPASCPPADVPISRDVRRDRCWVCWTGAVDEPLEAPGESRCPYCNMTLPPLSKTIIPPHLRHTVHQVVPHLAVAFQGKTYRIPVRPGPMGMAEFKARLRRELDIPDRTPFHVSFQCAEPSSGKTFTLSGMQCFNAAATCAAVSAAKRAVGEDGGFLWDEHTADPRDIIDPPDEPPGQAWPRRSSQGGEAPPYGSVRRRPRLYTMAAAALCCLAAGVITAVVWSS